MVRKFKLFSGFHGQHSSFYIITVEKLLWWPEEILWKTWLTATSSPGTSERWQGTHICTYRASQIVSIRQAPFFIKFTRNFMYIFPHFMKAVTFSPCMYVPEGEQMLSDNNRHTRIEEEGKGIQLIFLCYYSSSPSTPFSSSSSSSLVSQGERWWIFLCIYIRYTHFVVWEKGLEHRSVLYPSFCSAAPSKRWNYYVEKEKKILHKIIVSFLLSATCV